MGRHSTSTILKEYVILFSISSFIHSIDSQDLVCNAAADQGREGFVSGRCVTFPECPPLDKLIRSSSITATELKLLQRLTCLLDNENPTICCRVDDIQEVTNRNTEFAQPKVKPSVVDVILPPSPSVPAVPEIYEKNPSEASITDTIFFPTQPDKHKNFNLLPTLEECGNSVGPTNDRIIGGTNAAHGAYPWMARIGYENLETGEIEFFCGATVISKKYVITAAHCTEEIDEDEWRLAVIRLGEYNADSDPDCSPVLNCSRSVDFKIDKVIAHPGYSTEDKSNDIELIRVYGNIPFDTPFVKPICLPFEDEYDIKGKVKPNANEFVIRKGTVAGWGRTKWNKAAGSSILQVISLPLISNEECQANYSTKIRISPLQMCAGGVPNMDSCGGDSGGPIAVLVPLKVNHNSNALKPSIPKIRPTFFQMGVVSFGPVQCGVGGLPGVYTRIASYKKWILDNLEP